ncbi:MULTISPECIES: alcohol dehydrogenase catalytic domain-containing protein [unclassified Mycolicibacterium]|uniref:alcohol dehydrogenase catalytic domain-containing protein n=1 Tax=unclassified Mycolicibacterium TaxID=2636767 RepID=UPI002EDB8E40
MLALRAHAQTEGLVLEDAPVPTPGPHDVIVKVVSAGVAPGITRLLAMGGFKMLPTTIGHEAAGIVAEIGSEVAGFAVGDRVRMHPHLNCRNCRYCLSDREMMCIQQTVIGFASFNPVPSPLYAEYHNGGLAEYVRVPHWVLDPLHETVPFDVATKVHDLADAVRALKLADMPLGATLAITAPTGAMGTGTIKLAASFGVARLILIGRDHDRLQSAATLAGDIPTDVVTLAELDGDWETTEALPHRLRELAPQGVDAVLDYMPAGPIVGKVMAGLATGGALVHMGANFTPLQVSAGVLMQNCLRFIGTRACTRTDARQVLQLLSSGQLVADDLITHRFALKDAIEAVDAVQRRTEPMWMTVVNP